jgi:hypothetical protein
LPPDASIAHRGRVAIHRVAAFMTFLLLGPVSCLQIGTPDASDGGTGATAGGGSGGGMDAGPTGSGCALDTASGLTLCTAISTCPNFTVDHDAYPDCGFRMPSNAVELDCVCGDFICSLGAALNCAGAQSLLSQQSELAVCTQVSEGRCASRTQAPKTPGSCDKSCLAGCVGDPLCVTLCGC